MKESEARAQAAEFCRRLYDKGFMPGIDGNVSIRLDGERALVTPTGISKRRVTAEQLVLMSLSGERLKGDLQPSSEAPMHLGVYRHRPDVGAVVHTHSPNATAWAMTHRPLDTRYAPFSHIHLGAVGHVPYLSPGSAAFHQAVAEQVMAGHSAMMLCSHGAMTLGTDLDEAFDRMDLMEAYCGMLFKAAALGGAYLLTDRELDEITGG